VRQRREAQQAAAEREREPDRPIRGEGCVCPWLPRVRYTTSAELLRDLTASLADHSLPQRLRYDSNFDLLAIDEFGFDRIEGAECGQAAIRTEFAEKPGCITLRPVCWPQTVVVEKFGYSET
jgi:hypothetical protein